VVRRGEVWRTTFPDGKDRPGVVASPNVRNREGENVILAGCTSQRTDRIYPDEVKLEGLDLPVETKVQADYLFTLKQDRLKERVAILSDTHRTKFDRALMIALDLIS
jgi:mRNA-degrading endonuclease toxin of MazEF toxin-antitoxin module